MKPLKALTDRSAAIRDEASDGFSLAALEDLLSDCVAQPDWRPRADLAHAYYDMGKQLTPEKEAKIRREWGIEPRQTNLIHGVVNGVLGQEAKSRTEVRIEADSDDFADVADVLNKAHKEAQREANIDMAISNAYGGQVKGGIGWVEVSRASDPLDYPYRVLDIHRNEIWYDWRARQLGLQDARWLVRKRWEDLDEAVAMMPEHRDVLEHCVNGWDLVNLPDEGTTRIYRSWLGDRRSRILPDEWLDTGRKRIKFFEVWYRVPAEVVVLHMGPGKRVLYDETNPIHQQAVARGLVKVSKTVSRQVRMALFAGPVRLMDVGTKRRNFPYIPFFAFRDDEDRSPYGLIEGMISPQDEYNERRQMVNWMLQARQVFIESDALDPAYNTIKNFQREVMRPDMMAVLNPARRNQNGGIKVGNDLELQKEQFDVMQDAKQLIQDVPKVYSSQLGNAPAGVTSGIANSLLIEQGITAMGELNDNYRYGRKLVHEEVLSLIVEDHLEENLKVMVGSGEHRRAVVLNAWDPQTGAPINRVKDAPVKVGMTDVPVSPTARMQEQQQLATIIQALATNPAALNVLAPAYVEGSSLANRQALADDLRRATGQPVAGDRQGQQAAQAQAMQNAQQQIQLGHAAQKADIAKKAADTKLAQARAAQIEVDSTLQVRGQVVNEAQARMAAMQPQPVTEDQLIQEALAEASMPPPGQAAPGMQPMPA